MCVLSLKYVLETGMYLFKIFSVSTLFDAFINTHIKFISLSSIFFVNLWKMIHHNAALNTCFTFIYWQCLYNNVWNFKTYRSLYSIYLPLPFSSFTFFMNQLLKKKLKTKWFHINLVWKNQSETRKKVMYTVHVIVWCKEGSDRVNVISPFFHII